MGQRLRRVALLLAVLLAEAVALAPAASRLPMLSVMSQLRDRQWSHLGDWMLFVRDASNWQPLVPL